MKESAQHLQLLHNDTSYDIVKKRSSAAACSRSLDLTDLQPA